MRTRGAGDLRMDSPLGRAVHRHAPERVGGAGVIARRGQSARHVDAARQHVRHRIHARRRQSPFGHRFPLTVAQYQGVLVRAAAGPSAKQEDTARETRASGISAGLRQRRRGEPPAGVRFVPIGAIAPDLPAAFPVAPARDQQTPAVGARHVAGAGQRHGCACAPAQCRFAGESRRRQRGPPNQSEVPSSHSRVNLAYRIIAPAVRQRLLPDCDEQPVLSLRDAGIADLPARGSPECAERSNCARHSTTVPQPAASD